MDGVLLAIVLIGVLVFGLLVGMVITIVAMRQMNEWPVIVHIYVERVDRELAKKEREQIYGN